MGIIRFDLENLKVNTRIKPEIWPAFERFMQDMDNDVAGFFHLPANSNWAQEFADVRQKLVERLPEIDTFLHLGIGGSSLPAEATIKALGSPKAPTVYFLENVDPDFLTDILEKINPKRTLLYVVTKSGTTMETLAQFIHIYSWLEKNLGKEQAKNHLVFCTDPQKGDLRELANEWKIPTFSIPPSLGGRFSALSAVGFFPATVAGVNCAEMLKGAAEYRTHLIKQFQKGEIPEVLALADGLFTHYEKNNRPITVLMPYSQKLKTVGAWFSQLWAESLGKSGRGMTPVQATGVVDQHSILQLLCDGPQDKVVGFIEVQGFTNVLELKWTGPTLKNFSLVSGITMNLLLDAEYNATRQVLKNGERPLFSIVMHKLSPHTLGQLFYSLQVVTALTGYLMSINPFDQPGVEEGKIITKDHIIAAKSKLH